MRYYIADLHDMDENVILYTHRPFANAQEQHDEFVKRWNETVSDEDEVFLLGDVGDPHILCELNGNISIVCGNHDDYDEIAQFISKDKLHNVYVSKYPIFIEPVLLTHAPATFLPSELPYLNIHGHLHDAFYGKGDTWAEGRRYFNVAADMIGFAPISEKEIIEQLEYH